MNPPTIEPGWKRVLKQAGYPTDVVVLDFETYFDQYYSLKKMSMIEYVMDPRFALTGVGSYEGGTACFFPPDSPLWGLKNDKCLFNSCTVVSHNAAFDGLILAKRFGIHPPYYIDTLGLARQIGVNIEVGGKLEKLAKKFGLELKGDTGQFKGLKWEDMLGIQREALKEYTLGDVRIEWELFKILLPRFSRPEFELRLMQHTLEMFWKSNIKVDTDAAANLIAEIQDRLDILIKKTGFKHKEISGNIAFEKELSKLLDHHGESVPTKPGAAGPIMALAKDDPELDQLLRHSDERIRNLVAARSSIRSFPLHVKRIQRLRNQARAGDGSLPVPLHYCGTRTGRWSGGEKINLQNLGKRSKIEIVNKVRTILVPPDGYVFVVADASQIEARILAWIAGQADLVYSFGQGKDIYVEFASKIAGIPVDQMQPDDRNFKRFRQMGKVGILGCGYGMGSGKCQSHAAKSYQIDIDFETASQIVRTYRQSNRKIVGFWRKIENSFRYTTKYSQRATLDHLIFDRFDKTTTITLPSGRVLCYEDARAGPGPDLTIPKQHGHGREHIWGGFLTENVVQAIARDVLAEAILDLQDKYPVRLHIHDEVIGVVPKQDADDALEVTIKAMSVTPPWAPGLPLAAEGQIAETL